MAEGKKCDHSSCTCKSATTSVCQTISEMDWERGIWHAASTGDEAKVKALIIKAKHPHEAVRSVDNSGYTALHYAARNGYLTICEILVKNGALIDAVTKSGKATPLHRAASIGNTDIVMYLVNSGAVIGIQDADGKTAIHRAAENGHVDIVKILLDACPELLDIKDLKGRSVADILPTLKNDH